MCDCEGGCFSDRKAPSLALPPEKITVGRFWGRGRFSKRSASPPDPLSRRVAGNRLVRSYGLARPCSVDVSLISLFAVTAADRAAATCQRWIPTNYRKRAGEGFQRAIAKPPDGLRPLVVPERHETVTCGGFAATPRRLPQKEEDPSRSEWWKIYSSAATKPSPIKKAYPQSS